MKSKTVVAVRDVYMPFIKSGMEFLLEYGVRSGYEQFGKRFYLSEKPRFENHYDLVCALNKETAEDWFGKGVCDDLV